MGCKLKADTPRTPTRFQGFHSISGRLNLMARKDVDRTGHTVEKIGGTSMSNFDAVRKNIIVGDKRNEELYNRIFVVSAYGGVTDQLLEHKKTGKPGIYALFAGAENRWAWGDDLTRLEKSLTDINRSHFEDLSLRHQADQFILDRVEGVRACLIDLQRLCSYGHFQLRQHLVKVREMLAGVGEAHSAFNTSLRLQSEGINARFIDLTGWRESERLCMDEKLKRSLESVDLTRELPICTGYTQCKEGLIETFDRGYSEMTFSRIAVVTGAREAIIHKEFHLSSADPNIVDPAKVVTLGRANYDVADQLANLGMEAIHPKAARGLCSEGIPLRIKNSFEPKHPGTLITGGYQAETPQTDIVTGQKSVMAVSVFDQNAPSIAEIERTFLDVTSRFRVHRINRESNANTLTFYLSATLKQAKRIVNELGSNFSGAEISLRKVAVIAAIGSSLDVNNVLIASLVAFEQESIQVLAAHQTMRDVEVQFILDSDQFDHAVRLLHSVLIETRPKDREAVAA